MVTTYDAFVVNLRNIRNKHIVTLFWTIGTHCNFLTSDRHFGCKVVLSASFLKSDTGKNYKTSKKTDKVIPHEKMLCPKIAILTPPPVWLSSFRKY
jgi:hypothetical protein